MLGGLGAGLAYTFVRRLGLLQENSRRIVFWFSAFSCLLCLPFLAADYRPMQPWQTVYLLLAGTFACIGQLGITRAYLCAPAREISVYDYSRSSSPPFSAFGCSGSCPTSGACSATC